MDIKLHFTCHPCINDNSYILYSTTIGLTTGSATSSTVVPTNNHTIRRTIATTTPMTNQTFFFFIFMLFCFYYEHKTTDTMIWFKTSYHNSFFTKQPSYYHQSNIKQ